MIVGSSSRLVGSARSAHRLVQVQLTDDVPALGPRGAIVALSPGLARNRLVPAGLALYVDRTGKGVSAARDMERVALEKAKGLAGVLARQREQERARRAKQVLDEMSGAVAEDPLARARATEQALADSLATLVPSTSPLSFTRLTNSPTSSDLFGSVSAADVFAALRDRGVQGVAEGMGAFAEGQEGVLNGRIKRTGEFAFEVELKALEQKVRVPIEVVRDGGKA
ncbi:hypothetical protein Rhopal_000285-T1 [Rhodotorula paludigena]|uniref:Ribosomal protein L9 domain-containing protein n=1 Tax=Rhodotorula paludigena TaxID=86838 RepID=A0AAV5G4I1_9BASI|nr:hypothetical protein Rhopal_000285-T1 [Rhodotorula paludigena]